MAVDFRSQLSDQLDFIGTSCGVYDAGNQREGVRIAVSIRVICYSNPRSHSRSLLWHLHRENISLLSTTDGGPRRPDQQFFSALTRIEMNPVDELFQFIPKFGSDHPRPVSFAIWWTGETVYQWPKVGAGSGDEYPAELTRLTRKDLVLGAANKDGGAHVDDELEPRYEQVLGGMGWLMTVNPSPDVSKKLPLQFGHLAALRQMGHELLNSPALLKLAGRS